MSALYDFLPVPPKGNNESGSHLYPKLRPYKTVSFDELTEKIASHSGLTKGNILAVMEEIENWTKQLLSEGYRVQIGNIGTVSASLKADAEVYDKGDIHAQSIRFDKVKVTVSKQFSKQCGGKVLRAPSGKKFQQSSYTYTEEERLALLQSYLESHDYITRAEYGALTGLLKYKAWQ
ncbi:HU family DNA-binding protein, partial [Bacteroides gallinaceum]